MIARRSLLVRSLAAVATFSVAGAVVVALTVSPPADAKAKRSEEVALLEPPTQNTPPPAHKEPKKPSPARKFLPVHHFGGY